MNYLQNLHKEEGHRGISSLREYLYNNNIYFEGSSFLTEYIVKTCKSCAEKKIIKRQRKLYNKKILGDKGTNYILLKIPEILDILDYL